MDQTDFAVFGGIILGFPTGFFTAWKLLGLETLASLLIGGVLGWVVVAIALFLLIQLLGSLGERLRKKRK